SKLKATDWPYPIIQFFRGDITMTDLMAIASVSKGKMLETRAYLGFSKVFSQNAQEAKPDLQFVYNARAGSPLIRTLALRG
ncbi:hypothetical protein ACSLVQ_29860, partial [Klebsiella pneumoniae]|uniref:hypothetical protein n=1 Tax=Klebsiella pneumoniae TaxID=573 RepID=UPI003EE1232D